MKGTRLTPGEVIVSRDGTQYEVQSDTSLRKLSEKASRQEVQKLLGEEPAPGIAQSPLNKRVPLR